MISQVISNVGVAFLDQILHLLGLQIRWIHCGPFKKEYTNCFGMDSLDEDEAVKSSSKTNSGPLSLSLSLVFVKNSCKEMT